METSGDNGEMELTSLARDIRREKAQRAREMSLDERLTAGPRLYVEQMQMVWSLVAGLHPDWTEDQVSAEMLRRENLLRAQNTKKYYREVLSAEDPTVRQA